MVLASIHEGLLHNREDCHKSAIPSPWTDWFLSMKIRITPQTCTQQYLVCSLHVYKHLH